MLHDGSPVQFYACGSAFSSPIGSVSSAFSSCRLARAQRASRVPPDREISGEDLADHAARRLRALAAAEQAYAVDGDYLCTVQTFGMTAGWRDKIAQWYGELGHAFEMRKETIAIATNYLDRYLSRRSCESVDLQLAATASIFLASKVEEQKHFRTGDLVSLCGGLFSRSDLRLMEVNLMMTLGWQLNPPTVHANVYHLLALVPAELVGDRPRRVVRDRALEHAEQYRADYAFLRYPPSMAAVAAVVCGLRAVDAPRRATEAFIARVNALGLPYQKDPEAPQKMQDCGLRFLEEAADPRGESFPTDPLDVEVADLEHAEAPAGGEHGAPSPTDIALTDAIQVAELLADDASFGDLGLDDDRSPAKKPRYA